MHIPPAINVTIDNTAENTGRSIKKKTAFIKPFKDSYSARKSEDLDKSNGIFSTTFTSRPTFDF